MRSLFGLMVMLLAVTPASAASPVPTELYAEVDHALRPALVLADPVGYRGRTLLLGGVVVRTVSEYSGVTIEVEVFQLSGEDRPLTPDPALGKLLASGAGLDGAQLQPGRLVTLVGRMTGEGRNEPSGLPRLEVRFIHSWPTPEEEAAARAPGCSLGCCCDPWWYDPGCGPWYGGPYPRWQFGLGYSRHWH